MDEPGALDPITRDSLQELVKQLQQELGKTVVFVTHDMDEALKLADRILIMQKEHTIDAATHLVMPPMEFMQRLAATVPITLSRSRGASASGCFAATNCCIRRPGSRVGQQRARC